MGCVYIYSKVCGGLSEVCIKHLTHCLTLRKSPANVSSFKTMTSKEAEIIPHLLYYSSVHFCVIFAGSIAILMPTSLLVSFEFLP